MAGYGGKRPGAGRKPGVPTLKTQRIAAQAAADGITPLEVMIHNMRFWHHNAEALVTRLKEMSFDVTDEEERGKLLKALGQLMAFREKAEECAVDAAPYMHPKLASIEFKGNKDEPITHTFEAGKTLADLAAQYGEMIKRPE